MSHQLTRRQILHLATASAAGLGLAACGSGGSAGGTDGADGDSGKITVWSWTTAAEALRGVVPSFERDNPGIEVDVQDVGNPAIWDKITVGLASGGKGLADVLHIGVDYLPGYLEKFPDGLADLSRLGADRHKDAFVDGLWPTVMGKDRTVHALPWEVNPLGLFYRYDYFEKAGVDPASVTSWDDLIAAGPKIRAATGAQLLGLDKPGTTQDMDFFQNLMQLQGPSTSTPRAGSRSPPRRPSRPSPSSSGSTTPASSPTPPVRAPGSGSSARGSSPPPPTPPGPSSTWPPSSPRRAASGASCSRPPPSPAEDAAPSSTPPT